ncbi:hypothetical protein [Streptomyces sp. AF1A]|uniref:hypothetical protein n=1 Tax=Streptomyces sp. AF1A TaxID=3394350 RepID=UPI0039BC9DEA
MEQRIGSSSKPLKAEPLKTEPVTGAGFDPAFIPGITAPAAEHAEPEPAEREAAEASDTTSASNASDSSGPSDASDASDAEASAQPEDEAPAQADEEDDEAAAEGPVFEASDRRARIVADRKGIRLRLDEESCEFTWDEIAAVETESPRFGKRFTITVHTPERRWYPIEIEATSRSRFQEWDEQLDAVLDAYFEEAE